MHVWCFQSSTSVCMCGAFKVLHLYACVVLSKLHLYACVVLSKLHLYACVVLSKFYICMHVWCFQSSTSVCMCGAFKVLHLYACVVLSKLLVWFVALHTANIFCLTNGSNHWILCQPDQVSKTETMARGTDVLFAPTSDRLPSHPTKDGRATDSCFACFVCHV